jgi:hypothetical protein
VALPAAFVRVALARPLLVLACLLGTARRSQLRGRRRLLQSIEGHMIECK